MKLSILVPQYDETDEVIRPLLDSIAVQQNVDFNEIEVIICNDGSDIHLTDAVLKRDYPFKIEYHLEEHGGVSATRNKCFEHSHGDYVMWCDIDDMFMNVCGLYIVFREIDQLGGFDSLVSAFTEESKHPETGEHIYVPHEMDSTFVHGKVHNRKFLINNNIKWNNNLTIHEDSYFNCLCQKMAKELKYCPTPFYLWKWRDASVCRHDPKYILKTYNNMLDSNTALVNEFMDRRRKEDAQFYATMMIFDAYYCLNKNEWWETENADYKLAVQKRFKKYYLQFKDLFDTIDEQVKNQIIVGIKNRMFGEGLMLEKITFEDWIKEILSLED